MFSMITSEHPQKEDNQDSINKIMIQQYLFPARYNDVDRNNAMKKKKRLEKTNSQ